MKRLFIYILVMAFAVSARAAEPESTAWDHFAWGAEIGGAIDMSSNDMSTLDIGAYFGYKNSFIDIAGIGTGINVMVNNSSRAFPVYGIFRSSFRSRPSFCFADLRAGCVFNEIGNKANQARLFLSPGVGFNLACGDSFKSYIILSYVYNGMRCDGENTEYRNVRGLDMACVRIGITF